MKIEDVLAIGFKAKNGYGGIGKAILSIQYQPLGQIAVIEYWNLTERVDLIVSQGGDGEPGQYTVLPLNYIDTIEKLKIFIKLLSNVDLYDPTNNKKRQNEQGAILENNNEFPRCICGRTGNE